MGTGIDIVLQNMKRESARHFMRERDNVID